MTTKVPTEHDSPQNTISTSITHHKPPPQRSMCQSTSINSTQLESCYISLQAVTLYLQQKQSSPTGCLSTIPFFPAALVSRPETWSDSASEETYILYSPARDFDGLQIFPTRPPGSLPITPQQVIRKIPQ